MSVLDRIRWSLDRHLRRLRPVLGAGRRRIGQAMGRTRALIAGRSRRWPIAAGGAAVLVLLPLVVFIATRGGSAGSGPTTMRNSRTRASGAATFTDLRSCSFEKLRSLAHDDVSVWIVRRPLRRRTGRA